MDFDLKSDKKIKMKYIKSLIKITNQIHWILNLLLRASLVTVMNGNVKNTNYL